MYHVNVFFTALFIFCMAAGAAGHTAFISGVLAIGLNFAVISCLFCLFVLPKTSVSF